MNTQEIAEEVTRQTTAALEKSAEKPSQGGRLTVTVTIFPGGGYLQEIAHELRRIRAAIEDNADAAGHAAKSIGDDICLHRAETAGELHEIVLGLDRLEDKIK